MARISSPICTFLVASSSTSASVWVENTSRIPGPKSISINNHPLFENSSAPSPPSENSLFSLRIRFRYFSFFTNPYRPPDILRIEESGPKACPHTPPYLSIFFFMRLPSSPSKTSQRQAISYPSRPIILPISIDLATLSSADLTSEFNKYVL